MKVKQLSGSSLRAVVFDLFHTLVDPEDFRPRNFRRTVRVADLLQVDHDHFTSYWEQTSSIRNTNRSNTVVKLVEKYLSKTGRTSDADILAQVDYELGRYQDLAIVHPRPNVGPLLKTLAGQGFKLGLLTNSDEREIREWPHSQLVSYFDAACFSCEIGFEKPQLEAYRKVLERLGTPASEAAYVGDGGSNELEGARAAGFGLVVFMKMFVADNGLRTSDELGVFMESADTTAETLEELPVILASRSR